MNRFIEEFAIFVLRKTIKTRYMKRIFYFALLIPFFFSCEKDQKTREELIKEIMDTDIAFSDYSVKEGKNNAFITFADHNAVLMRSHGMPLEGLAAIKEHITMRPDTGYVLTWKPIFGEVSSSGDLGYTYGTWEFKTKPDTAAFQGTYTTIWKKQADNTWKWVLDTGNEGLK
jgi:ketosteroid isomerase-like protein